MYEVGSTVVNTLNMKQATVCGVVINENVLEEKGWSEPKVEVQYQNGIREWINMSQTKQFLTEHDPTDTGEWLQD